MFSEVLYSVAQKPVHRLLAWLGHLRPQEPGQGSCRAHLAVGHRLNRDAFVGAPSEPSPEVSPTSLSEWESRIFGFFAIFVMLTTISTSQVVSCGDAGASIDGQKIGCAAALPQSLRPRLKGNDGQGNGAPTHIACDNQDIVVWSAWGFEGAASVCRSDATQTFISSPAPACCHCRGDQSHTASE